MQFKDFFTKEYLLDPTPPQESKLYIPLIILFSFLILLAIGILFTKKDIRKIANKYFYAFLISGISGLIYLFSRYEGLPIFGSRFFLIVVFLILLIWMIINVIWMIRRLPNHFKTKKREEKYLKYLPKQKSN